MRRIFLLFFLLPAMQSLLAQNNLPAGSVTHKPDTAAGVISFNAQGQPQILTPPPVMHTTPGQVAKPSVGSASQSLSQAKGNAVKNLKQVNTAAPPPAPKKTARPMSPPPLLLDNNK